MQYSVLDIVFFDVRIQSYNQNVVTVFFQAFFQRFDMGYDAADEGIIGFRENGNVHSSYLKKMVTRRLRNYHAQKPNSGFLKNPFAFVSSNYGKGLRNDGFSSIISAVF